MTTLARCCWPIPNLRRQSNSLSSALLATLLLVHFAFAAGAQLGQAAEETPENVWLISTRSAPGNAVVDESDANFDYWRLGADRQWNAAELSDLLATDDPNVPTTVFVHGNRADRDMAVRQAWPVYRFLKQQADGRQLRFVIWSWPADRIRGRNVRDLRVKANRSDTQGFYLAWYLDQLRTDVPVNLVGYSFGARVVTGALHILGGGQSAGNRLPEEGEPFQRRPYRVVLVAAALDNDWLLPGHRHGLAMTQVESLLITENPQDRALRWYPALWRPQRPQALGYDGPVSLARLGTMREKVHLIGLADQVGKEHDWSRYLSAPELQAQLSSYAFLDAPAGTAVAAKPVVAGPAAAEVAQHDEPRPDQPR